MKGKENYQRKDLLIKLAVIISTGVLNAVALNMFLIPAHVFSAGMNGVAQLISGAADMFAGIKIDTGLLIFICNIPVFILGWLKLGKGATFYSLLTVASVSFLTVLVPKVVVTENIMLNAIVGGVLVGIGAGLCLKYGFTTGGMDLLSLIISKSTGKTVGSLIFFMNLIIILFAGVLYDWESALFTIVSIFCLSQVVDVIHTNSQKITVFIVSPNHSQDILVKIRETVMRGTTLMPIRGGYSGQEGNMIMIVLNRYELYDVERIVGETDPTAFMNVIPTQMVMGNYWTEEQQKEMMSQRKQQEIELLEK